MAFAMLHMAFGIVGVSILCFMLSGPEVLNFHSLFFLRFAGRYEQTCDAYEIKQQTEIEAMKIQAFKIHTAPNSHAQVLSRLT